MAAMRLPEGYWIDRVTDPDVLILRRPDGSVVAVFSAWGAAAEAIEAAAQEDAGRDQ
jgi:hypothetical protein